MKIKGTELEKVLNVPSIRNRASSMFLKFLPLLTKSAEEKFTKSVEKNRNNHKNRHDIRNICPVLSL